MLLKKYSSLYVYSLCISTIITCVNAMEKQNPIDLLLSNPEIVLSNIQQISTKSTFDSRIFDVYDNNNCVEARNSFYTIIREYEQQEPFFLINECPYQTGNKDCNLGRNKNPQLRALFEEKISHELSQKIGRHKNNFASYVGFGAGSGFSDFRVLANTLKDHGEAHLHIHLIDKQYQIYATANAIGEMDNIMNAVTHPCCASHHVTLHETEKFPSVACKFMLSQLLCRMAQNKGLADDVSISTLKKFFLTGYLLIEAQHQQLLRSLKEKFTHANLELFVHTSHNDYLCYVITKQLPLADVIVASDIDSPRDIEAGSAREYTMLCLAMLHKNPYLYNATLDVKKQQPRITTVSLNQLSGKLVVDPLFPQTTEKKDASKSSKESEEKQTSKDYKKSIAIRGSTSKIFGYLNMGYLGKK